MATRSYADHVHNSHHFPEENYRNIEWGRPNDSDRPPVPPLYIPNQRYHLDYYPTERPVYDQANVDYSQIASLDTGFKKLKSNQIQILKQLKRQYEVLRNTELESGSMFASKKLPTERSQSNGESVSKSRSDARSSSYSRVERTRRKSQHKQLQMAALQRKQMELMLNNSMKKIEQLLSSEITLKKTVLQLRNQLESIQSHEQQHNLTTRKYRDEIQDLKKKLQEAKREIDTLKSKLKQKNSAFGTLQGEIAVNHLQLRKKEERIRALQEEIYLEKNKYCNLELDLKKCRLQAEMVQRSLKEELAILQRKLSSVEEHQLFEKNELIQKLSREIQVKDERYKLLLDNKEAEGKKEEKEKQVQDNVEQREHIKRLQRQIQQLKAEKHQKSGHSESVLCSILEKLAQLPVKQDQQLLAEVHSLRQQLQGIQSRSKHDREAGLNQRIRELERNINDLEKNMEDENIQKMYFIQDIKKIKAQMAQERRKKEQALQDARELRQALRKVQQEARKHTYELQALKNANLDLLESQHQNRTLMAKSQHFQFKEVELAELKEQNSKLIEQHKSQIEDYEQEIKLLKRKIAEEQVKAFKIKQELELKMSLSHTQFQAQLNRLRNELQRIKKSHIIEMNERIGEKTLIEGKLLQKNRELQRITNQLNAFVKERDSVFQAYRAEHEKRVQAIQEENATKVDGLAQKIESLAELANKHAEVLHRAAILEQQAIDLKRTLRHNRQVNDGIDHLWSIKEAEYSNINQILKAFQ